MTDVRRKTNSLLGSIAALAGVVLLYALSYGPAARLAEAGYISHRKVNTVYSPVLWLANRNNTFRDVFLWYGKKWLSKEV